MTRAKPTMENMPSSEDVLFFGTAFVAESDAVMTRVEEPLPVQCAHVESRILDASFLSNCLRMLIVARSAANADWSDALRQVACTGHCSSTAVHVYACSRAVRDLLAELSDEQGAKLGEDLYRSRRRRPQAADRDQDRPEKPFVTLVKDLVVLAREARDRNRNLALRVEYRRRGNLS
jgi:hypothetical protein